HALLVAPVRDLVHRGAALAPGPRPRAGDGTRGLRLARGEAGSVWHTLGCPRQARGGLRRPGPPPRAGDGTRGLRLARVEAVSVWHTLGCPRGGRGGRRRTPPRTCNPLSTAS